MKVFSKKKFASFFSVLLALLVVLSGCQVAFRGDLADGEQFYLQNVDGSTSLTEVNNTENVYTNVDPSTTVGGFIQSPLGDTSVYWVPKYRQSQDGSTYYDFNTETGRPTKVPAGASVNNLIINPMDPNQVVVSLNVLDQNQNNVDGYTHVFVNEANPKNNILFYDFDHVYSNFLIPFDPVTGEPIAQPDPAAQGWNTADSTSTIFGYYHVDSSFFNRFNEAYGLNGQTVIEQFLGGGLEENTDSPKDGVTSVFSRINDAVWQKGSFSLDLKTGGENHFATVEVPLPKLTANETKTGTVQLSWPAVFGDASGYHIFQDGQQIAEVGKDTTAYEVTGLTVGQTYQFTVKGIVQANGSAVDSVLALNASQLVSDIDAPVLTLNGDNPLTIAKGSTYEEPGYTAVDDVDGDVTAKVAVTGQVDANTVGEYQLVYSVTDNAGNKAEAARTVKVVDQSAPDITLNGDNPLTIEQGSTFTDPGATASDDVDGDLTDKVTVSGAVDVNTPGEYKLVYSVTDSSGNKAEATRTVVVKAKQVVQQPTQNDNGGSDTPSKPLPQTSTNQYNWMMAGVLVVLTGILMYLISLKRRHAA